jgi:hypothetical protein
MRPVSHLPAPVEGLVVVVSCLARCVEAWWEIGVGVVVLGIVCEGLCLLLLGSPVEDDWQLPFMPNQLAWLAVEMGWLVEVQAIEWMGNGLVWLAGIVLICLVFLVPKKGPKLWCLVIDQCWLNLVLGEICCKFELLLTLIRLAGRGWWAITFDLAQGYHHISIHPELLKWFGFCIGSSWYWYCVMLFSLWWSLWVFMKVVWAMSSPGGRLVCWSLSTLMTLWWWPCWWRSSTGFRIR